MLQRAGDRGVARILVPGWDLYSSEAALELAARHGPLVLAAVGIHPHHAAAADEAAWARIELLAADPQCIAVGEIGLDFHRNLSPPAIQHEAFARQLDLAGRLDLPVLVHDREAHDAVTDALLAWDGGRGRRARGVLHAYSGDGPMAMRVADAGFLVSFALPVSFRSAHGPRAAAAALAGDRILTETDAPYLGPEAGRRNEPATVLRVAAELARLRQSTPEEIAAAGARAFAQLAPAST